MYSPLIAALVVGALFAAPAEAAPAPVSSHAMIHACCTPDALAERIFMESRALGARFVRVDFELDSVFEDYGGGPRAEPSWASVDRVVALARRHQLGVLGILLAPPAYLTTCPERWPDARRCAAADPEEFGRLAGLVAERARTRITHWEILNEPDGAWAFEGSPEEYARMLSAAYDAIKARVPAATVVMGGVQSPHVSPWLDRVLTTGDTARSFDVANVHLRGPLGAVVARYAEFRSRLAGRGFRGPVWVTEHGYPADPAYQSDPGYRGGEAQQAAYLTQSIVGLGEAGAEQVFVTLRDNLSGQYASEGLVHIEETAGYLVRRRPSFAAVRRLVASWDQLMAWRAEQRRFEALERTHVDALALARVHVKIARRRFRSARALIHSLQRRGRGREASELLSEARTALGWRRAYVAYERTRAALAGLAAADMRRRIAGS